MGHLYHGYVSHNQRVYHISSYDLLNINPIISNLSLILVQWLNNDGYLAAPTLLGGWPQRRVKPKVLPMLWVKQCHFYHKNDNGNHSTVIKMLIFSENGYHSFTNNYLKQDVERCWKMLKSERGGWDSARWIVAHSTFLKMHLHTQNESIMSFW